MNVKLTGGQEAFVKIMDRAPYFEVGWLAKTSTCCRSLRFKRLNPEFTKPSLGQHWKRMEVSFVSTLSTQVNGDLSHYAYRSITQGECVAFLPAYTQNESWVIITHSTSAIQGPVVAD
jgi:hypothetical protein